MKLAHQTLLRMPDVLSRTGMSRSGIYNLVAVGKFPKPVKLGERAAAWIASEVDAWIAERIAARDEARAA